MAPAGACQQIMAVLDTAVAGCVDAGLLRQQDVQVGSTGLNR